MLADLMSDMKRVYFVRHGESAGNVTGIHNDPLGSLTPEGERQAAILAQRFANLDVDVIIASTYQRAQETANIINEILKKETVSSDLFIEKRYPSLMKGLPKDDPVRKELDSAFEQHLNEPDYRHSDEENFTDLKARAEKALAFLIARPEAHLLVVTHGWFLRVLIASMLHGSVLTHREYLAIWKFFATRNTGLTLAEYDESNLNKGWRLHTWNDHAHLG